MPFPVDLYCPQCRATLNFIPEGKLVEDEHVPSLGWTLRRTAPRKFLSCPGCEYVWDVPTGQGYGDSPPTV